MKMKLNPMGPHKRRYFKCHACPHITVTINTWYGDKCPICGGRMREVDSRDKDVAIFIRREEERQKL